MTDDVRMRPADRATTAAKAASAARPAETPLPGTPAHAIVCDNLVKIYKVADLEVVALQGLDLVVERGEMVAIVGASGSGKSTLLAILSGMEEPSAGSAVVEGRNLGRLRGSERTAIRWFK